MVVDTLEKMRLRWSFRSWNIRYMAASTENLILANLIAERRVSHGDLDVLTFVKIDDTGNFQEEIRTYEQLWAHGQKVASCLEEEGMDREDSFGVIMQNHPEFVDVMVGSSIAGTVFVPIDPRTRSKKLAFMLNHAGCKGAVVGNYAIRNLFSYR